MNLKLLLIINDQEKNLSRFVDKYNLPFNALLHGEGTASEGILKFLGLTKTDKNILLSIIPDILEKKIVSFLKNETNIKQIGKGVAFTMPLSSSSKYIQETFKNMEGEKIVNKSKYHLIITIANEGSVDKIMNIAKKNGANGGTLIKGRGIGEKNSFKLFNVTVEPEKDVILIVCKDEDKNKIMSGILEKNGMNTENRAICFSLPIDSTIGIDE